MTQRSVNAKNDILSLVYVYTGEGKGKTSAALGTLLRGLANGWRVSWLAFYKEASWGISEYELPQMLLKRYRQQLEMLPLGKGFYIATPEAVAEDASRSIKIASLTRGKVVDDNSVDEHQAAAQATLDMAFTVIQQPQPPQLLVLDEVCNAIQDGLIEEQRVLDLLVQRQTCHVVLTGRSASKRLMAAADLVTEMKKVKHPYDEGVMAVKGLDF